MKVRERRCWPNTAPVTDLLRIIKIAKMADTAWLQIREQNLRFRLMKLDVDKKRPFYFVRPGTWTACWSCA